LGFEPIFSPLRRIFEAAWRRKASSELSPRWRFVSAVRQRWPSQLWIIRHGQSAGNVARAAAVATGAHQIGLEVRDVDIPLSELGFRQAEAVGRWFSAMLPEQRPEVVIASPYLRARQTAEAICRHSGIVDCAKGPLIDERLREREFGILDRLTAEGIRALYPDQAEHRRLLGKFYHRPPGGESWADVILRLRSVLDTISLHYADRRVMVVCHQVVVLCLRYILEELDEAGVMAIDKESAVLNCGICEYDFEPDDSQLCVPRLLRYNFAAPLVEEQAPVTAEPDEIVGAR
jgi:2,3-bisphosphoglycerate-dependent phosphoglycerate mutase